MADLLTIFPGESEMARRMRAFDWAATPLGPPDAWPMNLRVAVSVCLSSRFPMHVWWGPSLTLLYNDAYISFLGPSKHPTVLGRSGRDAWAEIWTIIGPMIDGVFRKGVASWSEDILMFFDRELAQEEVYVTFSFSPVFGDQQTVDGMFCACTETTDKIVGNRRLETLRQLGAQATGARRIAQACEAVGQVFNQNPYDLPFAALYLLSDDRRDARLASATGFHIGGWQPPPGMALDDRHAVWPLADVLETKRPVDLRLDTTPFAGLLGPWPHPLRQAVVLPVRGSTQEQVAGFLVAGISTRRPLDDGYRTFLELVAGQIAAALTEARAYEDERARADGLAALDRAKTDFFSNVSHEFRTPLTLMLGPLEEELQAARSRARLKTVHRNARRLLKLVNTLLDFSRIEAGRIEAAYEPTDLGVVTAGLASVFQSAIEKAGMRLLLDCEALPQPVYVDRNMWEKIVLNLVSNAFKFTFEGEIHVALRAVGGRAELTVTDTGVGIPAAELPRVFERFHRVLATPSRTHEGSGIGLALVQQLVKLHGGDIDVESTPRRGTRFTVRVPFGTAHLPAGRIANPRPLGGASDLTASVFVEEAELWVPDVESDARRDTDARPSARGKRPRILLADDNAELRRYVAGLLRRDYDVIPVHDGEEALAAAMDQQPDLVLADIMMPRLDGHQLVAQLRTNPATARLPIILLSARAGEEAKAEGLAHGCDDYLVKPFSARELRARVSTHLELARARQAAERALQASKSELEHEVSERTAELRGAEAAIRESEARQSFLLRLSDALRPLRDASAIQSEAARLLREHFDAGWSFYVEFNDSHTLMTVARDSVREGRPSMVGKHDFSDMPEFLELFRAGQIVIVEDFQHTPLRSQRATDWYVAAGIQAFLGVPVLKDGEPIAALVLADTEPHSWPPLAIDLTIESAERTWAAVERVRAEAALRRAHAELETRVRRRTTDLANANARLEREVVERRAAEQQIKALFKRVVSIQEEERRRIARDIHDQLGQQMTALRMNLEAVHRRSRDADWLTQV
ncbi:MAG TPA: ATP-binding protein, partial [Vicinamibacterales bacterium]